MRLLINMDNKSEIGYIDWEFIHDMQGIAPDMVTPEIIYLTHDFMEQVPDKWGKIKAKLESHVVSNRTIHCAISDVENLGTDFKLKGRLKSVKGHILPFHKVVIFDKDRFEDDYIGAVISNKDGYFSLSFGKKTFSDFGIEAEPDIYFKVFSWQGNHFIEIGKTMPEVFEKTETGDDKIILEFGVVTV